MTQQKYTLNDRICLVAILKDELPFLDEWIAYHRMIGIDYFILYDDDHPSFPLVDFLRPHREYVKVIEWCGHDRTIPGIMNQTNAYKHALKNHISAYEWVTFIDADEFIVVRSHESLKEYLLQFDGYPSVSLNWHVFGHNGHYSNPEGLITSSMTRRMYKPSKNVKSITRVSAIEDIGSPHSCKLKYGSRVDANKNKFREELYSGRTDNAHINHYQCRSFLNWMNRANRGDVNFNDGNCPKEQQWRLTEESCLRQFVTTVALNKNEYIDEYMMKYKVALEEMISCLAR